MTPPLLTQHPHYAALLRRWNELDAILYPTYRERVERKVLGEQLAALEAEYKRRVGARGDAAIAELTDDYEFMVGEAGNLGGCEVL